MCTCTYNSSSVYSIIELFNMLAKLVQLYIMKMNSSSLVCGLFLVISAQAPELSLGQDVNDVIFIHHPHNTEATIGKSAFFPCTYNGTRGAPHWVVNQTHTYLVSALPSGHSHNGTGLIVDNVDISMNATEYQCCFEGPVGLGVIEQICSSAGTLIITAGFTQYPTSVVTTPGEMGRFQCMAVATSVCNIQWRINHTLIVDSEADAYSIPARAGVGMLSSTLHVLAAPQHNNSEVECCTYSETGEEICTSAVNLTITGVQNIPDVMPSRVSRVPDAGVICSSAPGATTNTPSGDTGNIVIATVSVVGITLFVVVLNLGVTCFCLSKLKRSSFANNHHTDPSFNRVEKQKDIWGSHSRENHAHTFNNATTQLQQQVRYMQDSRTGRNVHLSNMASSSEVMFPRFQNIARKGLDLPLDATLV